MRRYPLSVAAAVLLTGSLIACGGGDADTSKANQARGAIKIWLSNNKEEVAWGEAMVAAWNAAHADEKVTAEQIPAGRTSEEVITAAITGGNAPCLIFNTAPAAVPEFEKMGGLVPLDDFPDGVSYVRARSGDVAEQYASPDGKFRQLPWKSNPVRIFFNKKLFQQAGLNPDGSSLNSYAGFLDASRKLVATKAAQAAIWPAPSNEFFQPWFDFYPMFAAETGGRQLVVDGKPTFDSAEGRAVAGLWRTMYDEALAPREKYTGDAFAEGKAAMAIVGPWAIAVYKDKVEWGSVPVPTSAGKLADQIWTFSDAKNVAMYSSCANRGTAWDLMKFATSTEQDGKLLQASGQMPLRTNLPAAYPDFFTANPTYRAFADQAARTVEVPNVPNSVKIWQTFRDAYSASVIFGREDPAAALAKASTEIAKLAGGK
ncbi:extracellular solute-binding protein [Virgisporangium aurantiacum]|uniref:Sugar ABC transporter substrate-binding protein n=1 Tax=Virgisporangium aurantiacum TaxID=175570 RepID=A0A8J4E3P2_9ACTN|nr:extracellular solute-binding protein [Virgisporangium aurantiacum]GIJ60326.1 sugar ABC transporter substrate-binding protein [Virgisporangium aurantiacum]